MSIISVIDHLRTEKNKGLKNAALKNIYIVGLGIADAGIAEISILDTHARETLLAADVIIGSARQLDIVKKFVINSRKIELPKLTELKTVINRCPEKTVVVLASGDPLYFGIGRWIYRHCSEHNIICHGAISSVQAACHRLGIALQDVEVVSLHGRPLASIKPSLKRNKTLVILTDKLSGPRELARECVVANFTDSSIHVCENLGYQNETVRGFSVAELVNCTDVFSELNVCVIHLIGLGQVQPEFPGIPDHHFQTGEVPGKGMISKREVRLCILSFMQVNADDVVWDIGAGCGGVAVEMAYWQPKATIYALECHPDRLRYLRENRENFGVIKNLHVIEGRAPEAQAQLPVPSKVFIGGSDGELPVLLTSIWALLPESGVLVASGVMARTKDELRHFAKQLRPEQVECVEVSVKRARLEQAQSKQFHLDYVQKLPVEIFKFIKAVNAS